MKRYFLSAYAYMYVGFWSMQSFDSIEACTCSLFQTLRIYKFIYCCYKNYDLHNAKVVNSDKVYIKHRNTLFMRLCTCAIQHKSEYGSLLKRANCMV